VRRRARENPYCDSAGTTMLFLTDLQTLTRLCYAPIITENNFRNPKTDVKRQSRGEKRRGGRETGEYPEWQREKQRSATG
jgi:hypothetical protein